jgi:hypothetical protein
VLGVFLKNKAPVFRGFIEAVLYRLDQQIVSFARIIYMKRHETPCFFLVAANLYEESDARRNSHNDIIWMGMNDEFSVAENAEYSSRGDIACARECKKWPRGDWTPVLETIVVTIVDGRTTLDPFEFTLIVIVIGIGTQIIAGDSDRYCMVVKYNVIRFPKLVHKRQNKTFFDGRHGTSSSLI